MWKTALTSVCETPKVLKLSLCQNLCPQNCHVRWLCETHKSRKVTARLLRRGSQKKNYEILDICPKQEYPTYLVPQYGQKKKFGQVSPCLPFLPFQKVWTFWNEDLLVIFTYFRFFSQTELSLFGGQTFGCKITPFFLQKTLFAIIFAGFFLKTPLPIPEI